MESAFKSHPRIFVLDDEITIARMLSVMLQMHLFDAVPYAGPAGRLPNVSPARKGWVANPRFDASAVGAGAQCRTYGLIILGTYNPALPGWADVWQAARRALDPWRSLQVIALLNSDRESG